MWNRIMCVCVCVCLSAKTCVHNSSLKSFCVCFCIVQICYFYVMFFIWKSFLLIIIWCVLERVIFRTKMLSICFLCSFESLFVLFVCFFQWCIQQERKTNSNKIKYTKKINSSIHQLFFETKKEKNSISNKMIEYKRDTLIKNWVKIATRAFNRILPYITRVISGSSSLALTFCVCLCGVEFQTLFCGTKINFAYKIFGRVYNFLIMHKAETLVNTSKINSLLFSLDHSNAI